MKARTMLLGLLSLTSLGCASMFREVTMAPDFAYVDRKELSSTMWRLAFGVADLNSLLENGVSSPTEQADVVSRLKDMQLAVQELSVDGKTTNHPRLDANLPQFESDLKLAQQMAENRPPNYFLAGRITGTCSYCHSKQK